MLLRDRAFGFITRSNTIRCRFKGLFSIAEELRATKDRTKQSELADLIARRYLSLRRVREILDQINQINNDGMSASYYQDREDRKKRVDRAFDKFITALKIALNRISTIIYDMEDEAGLSVNCSCSIRTWSMIR